MAGKKAKLCPSCNRLLDSMNFYTKRNGEKTGLCKTCLTMELDNYQEDTYTWILRDLDIPYIPLMWVQCREAAEAEAKHKGKEFISRTSVLGKYAAKMRLNQYKNKGYEDSEEAQKLYSQAIGNVEDNEAVLDAREKILQEQLDNGQISEAEYKTLLSSIESERTLTKVISTSSANAIPTRLIGEDNAYNENNFISEEELNKDLNLTPEDRQMLALKWGRLYKESEWVTLEKDYRDMTDSFDIQDADTKKSLVFLCQTNLKASQCLECGDIDGFQKLQRVSNDLRKSMKLTAAQRKVENDDFVQSHGQIVDYCEKYGGKIPRLEFDTDYDIVDTVIKDLKGYQKDLFFSDPALARMVEDYLKRREIADNEKREREQLKEQGLELEDVELTDEDYMQRLLQTAQEREFDSNIDEHSSGFDINREDDE